MKQYTIKFRFIDALSNGHWIVQQCSLYANDPYSAKQKCIELYGLGIDCEYEIISVEEI